LLRHKNRNLMIAPFVRNEKANICTVRYAEEGA